MPLVLAIDGFRLDGDNIQPLLEHRIDLSSSTGSGDPNQKAADLLATRVDSDLWFEVVVDR